MDYTIVTLRFGENAPEVDLELPLKLSIGELTKKLLVTLKAIDYERFARIDSIGLVFQGRRLDPELTLEHYGVWDGSYLTVIQL